MMARPIIDEHYISSFLFLFQSCTFSYNLYILLFLQKIIKLINKKINQKQQSNFHHIFQFFQQAQILLSYYSIFQIQIGVQLQQIICLSKNQIERSLDQIHAFLQIQRAKILYLNFLFYDIPVFFIQNICANQQEQRQQYQNISSSKNTKGQMSSRILRLNTMTSHSDEDYTAALNTLKNVNDKQVIDVEVNEQERTLNKIFVKTKTEKMQQIFINKLKRVLLTKHPAQIQQHQEVYGPCGILIQAIQFPDQLAHLIIFFYVIVVLVLMVLATFDGFIENFKTQKNMAAVLALKIACLIINVAYFVLKCTNRSFGNGQNLHYIHQVIKAYAKSWRLVIDFIVILFQIFTLIFPDVQQISGVFFFFLIIVLYITVSDFTHIQAAYLHSQKAFLIWGLIKVCLSNIIIAHIMASIILAMSYINTEKSWMVRLGIDEEEWWVKYVYSFYWGTTIMMTVGFGDVLPGNPREVIVTSFLEMFSCIVLGYNISEIGHLVSQLRQKTESVNRKIAIFDRMVKAKGKKHQISIHLQDQIFNHIKQADNSDNTLQFEQRKQLLSELPEHLRRKYYQEANKNVFASVLFFNNLKPSTMEQIAEKFTSQFYYQGENLVETNTKILILQEGNMGCGYRKRGSSRNGQIHDEIPVPGGTDTKLLTSTFLSLYREQNYDLIAKSYSIVWHIDVEDFLDCIVDSAIDFQYYFSVLHKHSLDEDQWETVECSRCLNSKNKNFHVAYNCPMVVYKPFREMIAMKHLTTSDLRQSQRMRRFRRNRNQYSRTSVLIHKENFDLLLGKINDLKNNSAVMTFMTTKEDGNNPSMREGVSKSLAENDILGLKKYAKQNPQNLQMDEIIDLFEIAIMKYETGYQNGYWDLEVDVLNNYQFYFPTNNANRLKKTSLLEPKIKSQRQFKRNIYVHSKQRPPTASSIQLDD